MTLQIIEELRTAPEYARLRKLGAAAVSIWLLFLIVFFVAYSAGKENVSRLDEAERVLRGATELRSYSERSVASTEEPLTAVSAILNKTGLQDKTKQLSSSAAGLALQVDRLYPDELQSLVEEISKNGLTVTTAEVRLLEAKRDGRLLDVTLAIVGETK